ncbi:hypothetical protein SeLEV6574_g03689 [Synchytrium endobioticum]|uniref:Uncharacterized protein n=1 Tax=Synchytrium endobioticum TaxID=286115 RepID=A0A507D339_9FUNG|nr:hypothetical protein SeLEV6574_g03689 [Synchytrium endobioticum]
MLFTAPSHSELRSGIALSEKHWWKSWKQLILWKSAWKKHHLNRKQYNDSLQNHIQLHCLWCRGAFAMAREACREQCVECPLRHVTAMDETTPSIDQVGAE